MTQAQRDNAAREVTRCPICRECGGHKLVNLTGDLQDCPLMTSEAWYRLSPITIAGKLRGVRTSDGLLGVAVSNGQWRVTAWDGASKTAPLTIWFPISA